LGEELYIREIRMVIENIGPRAAYFVLGPLHRKYRQVDLEAYDRELVCEFIPSARSADFVSLFIMYRILAELRAKFQQLVPPGGRTQDEIEKSIVKNVAVARELVLAPIRAVVTSSP